MLLTFAALLEISALPPVATEIASLTVIRTGIVLKLLLAWPVIPDVAFFKDYARSVGNDGESETIVMTVLQPIMRPTKNDRRHGRQI